MPTTSDKALTLLEATRTLFRTSAPTSEQVQRVYELMKSGVIAVREYGTSPTKWTTTEAALAEFMAARQLQRAQARRRGASPDVPSDGEALARWTAAHRQEADQMHRVYRHIWRDYFLAVMLRRRMAHRSAAFHRAVLMGQIVVLLSIAALFVGGVRQVSSWRKPMEQIALERWIDDNTDAFRITRWHPPAPSSDGAGVEVRVEYRYRKESPRWIQTDRTFRVDGVAVTELSP